MTYGVDRAIICPETGSQDGFYAALNGVIAHEMRHLLFGLADLYDVFTGRPVVGFWSLMDSGNLVAAPFLLPDGTESFAVGLLPPSVDPFHKYFISDALVFTDLAPGDTVTIADSARHPDVRRLFLSSDEYLLIENRAIAASDSVPATVTTTGATVPGTPAASGTTTRIRVGWASTTCAGAVPQSRRRVVSSAHRGLQLTCPRVSPDVVGVGVIA